MEWEINAFKHLSNNVKNVIDAYRQHNMSIVDKSKNIEKNHTTVSRHLPAKFL